MHSSFNTMVLDAIAAKQLGEARFFRIIDGNGAALAGSDILRPMETEAGRKTGLARANTVPLSFNGMGRIFDDRQVMLFGNLVNGFHICHLAIQVYGNNSLGLGGDSRFYFCDIDETSISLNINKYGFRAEINYRIGA